MNATDPNASRDVILCECFARDGLQHETAFLATDHKQQLIERFAALGFLRIEATSYSNPAVVPQFADASALLAQLPRKPGVFYKATCANVRAVERALADVAAGHGANEISLLVSASEAHSQKNLKRSRAEQWANVRAMAAAAQGQFRLIGSLSVAFGCPLEGAADEAVVIEDAARFAELGCSHVAVADTTGMATPRSIRRLFGRLLRELPQLQWVAHLHDTRGTGLVNALAACEAGVRCFDSAFGGTGGHPAGLVYGGGYTGNVCTEDLVCLFEAEGLRTGIDLGGLIDTATLCEQMLGRTLHGRVTRSGLLPGLA